MHSPNIPLVSIGVPVYNAEAVLRGALDSLLAQTFGDFEILISDNCSSDSTGAICLEYASKDPRIHYVRQPHNIGAFANFGYVLAQARAEYFMWNAADDTRSPDFVEPNLQFLESHLKYVGSTSPTRFVGGEFDPIRMGDAALEGTPEQNVISFFNSWHANGRFYSLYRRPAMTQCESIGRSFFANDWAIIIECCLRGKFHRSDGGWALIGRGGISQSARRFSAFRNHLYERIVPFFELSKVTWRISSGFSLQTRARLLVMLLRMNAIAALAQVRLAFRSMPR